MSILKAFAMPLNSFFLKIDICGPVLLLLQAGRMSSNIDEMYLQTENKVQLEEAQLSVSFPISLTEASEISQHSYSTPWTN